MPLGDSPRDPKPTPAMLGRIRQTERELERVYLDRVAREVQECLAMWEEESQR